MSTGEILSLLINIGVGLFFVRYYPAQVKRRFAGHRTPPLFAFLAKALPPVGWLLIAGSLLYGLVGVAGAG